jgi:hypothetical protein
MKKILLLFCFLVSFFTMQAQITLYSENFETDGEGTRYISNHYNDGLCNFFERSSASPINTCFSVTGTFTNFQGSFFWGSEDVTNNNTNPAGSLTTQSINVANYNTLNVSLFFATTVPGSFLRWEDSDSINIKASFDGGATYTVVGRFLGNDPSAGNLVMDVNLNGVADVGETTVVSISAFTKYTFSIPGTGSNLKIWIDYDQSGGTEEIGLDLIEVTGIALPCTAPTVATSPANTTTCASNNTSFTITANGTAPLNYQWQVNDGTGFVNIVNGGVYGNANSATLNITGATAIMNTYLYKCLVTNLCGSTASNSALLIVNTTNSWTGSVSTDWNTAGNWSCGTIPNATTNISIIGNPTNKPIIAPGATGLCNNMVKGGVALTLTLNDANLKISGNLTYNAGAIFTNANSSFQFVGTNGMQVFGGTAILTLNNLTINNSNGLLMSRSITLSGSLNFQQGKIFTNGFPLEVGSITGATNTNYIVTGDNLGNPSTIEGLNMTVNAGASIVFPIGPTATNFNPITIKNTSGPAEKFNVFVNLTALPGASVNKTVQRTWQIDEKTLLGGNTCELTLQWETADEAVSFVRSICGVYKSNGTNVVYTGYTPQNGAATNVLGNTWSKTLTGVTDFSPWGVTSDAGILPISLLFFTVQKNINNAFINWKIADASSASSFALEKSIDGINFVTIKNIIANTSLEYNYTDKLFAGINYYRLKSIERNGVILYSKIVSIPNKIVNTINVYPNPVKENTVLSFTALATEIGKIIITDIQGKEVLAKKTPIVKGINNIEMIIIDLQSGTYFTKIILQSGKILSLGKFVK